jgi:peptidoglycan/LPS O-acetylase OafA/YrhL
MSALLGTAVFSALVLVTAAVLNFFPSLARAVLGEDPPDRVASLDGLRGLLAISVFLHHAIIAHGSYGGRPWEPPPATFDNLAGQAAVALFFMISAYLFWGRVLASGGRLNWLRLFRGRIHRLAPAYYVAVALLFVIVAFESDFTLHVTAGTLAEQVLRWSGFALVPLSEINGVKNLSTILGTIWTLKYEWLFYFSLPLLAALLIVVRGPWPIYVAAAALAWLGGEWTMVVFFVAGAISIHLVALNDRLPWLKLAWSAGGLAALFALGMFFHDAFGPAQALLLTPIFIAALQAAGPWSILRWRPLQFLGHISYSVYLFHNPLIHVLTGAFGRSHYAALPTALLYPAILLMGMAVIAVSTATFLFIEKPFLGGRMAHADLDKSRANAASDADVRLSAP